VHPASPWFEFRFDKTKKPPDTPDLGAWSLPLDTTLAIMNILQKGTVDKFPDIKFIWPHGGGLSIGLLSRASALSGKQEDGFRKSYAKLRQTMSTFYYDLTNTTSKATSQSLLAVASPSHVLFGTDIPRGGNGRFSREQLMEIPNTGFAAADLPGIARGNAEVLFPRLRQQNT
jgi:predicted TIM-barrel fold metal-dependent hydrolase